MVFEDLDHGLALGVEDKLFAILLRADLGRRWERSEGFDTLLVLLELQQSPW